MKIPSFAIRDFFLTSQPLFITLTSFLVSKTLDALCLGNLRWNTNDGGA